MIRSVTAVSFGAGTPEDAINSMIRGLRSLQVDGMRNLECGRDLGLRQGNWDYVLTADFEDANAFRRFDEHPEHARIRAAIGPHVRAAVRVQFEIPG